MRLPGHSNPCLCSSCAPGHGGGSPLLSLCDVTFCREGRPILADINFTVDRGDFIAITGPNGGGKTTLLRLILGLLKPDKGQILYYGAGGTSIAGGTPKFRPGYLPQKNSVDAHFPITVGQVIALGLLGSKLSDDERKRRIADTLSLMELEALRHRPIGKLSGGQLQRTLLARAIVNRPDVIVLDEPLSYIDRLFEQRICDIVADLSQHSTILLVSHQMSRIAEGANRHVIVDHGLTECTHNRHYIPGEC